MIPVLRRQQILDLLTQQEVGYLNELADKLGISESTLRRDLKDLEQQGEVEVLRGGGVRLKKVAVELNLDEKIQLNKEEKERIAKYAASLIYPHDIIFLDPSSLNYLMVDYINFEDVTVVTNSVAIFNKLVKQDVKMVLVGGDVKAMTCSCVGPIAEQMISDLRFSKSFLGANGMSLEKGLTNHDVRERAIKKIAIENSVSTYFLVDSSKYGVVTMYKVADIDECTIITGKSHPDFSKLGNVIIA